VNILVLGGSRFVGRHITDAFLARGHYVTHFNRGISDPQGRADVETIHGDRASDLVRLGDRAWDAVIDTSGYTPDVVERSARFFAERAGWYLFISTISVYDISKTDGPDEDAPLSTLPPDADRTQMVPETYGALKVLCEEVVRSMFRQRATILRPGLVAGSDDPTDRFTYWPLRVAAGGQILVPVAPSEPLQYIDVRDLAEFALNLVEKHDCGTYNCVTPRGSLRFGDLLDACERVAHSAPSFTWVDADFLREHEVNPWSDLPLWTPAGDPHRGTINASSVRGLVRGLRNRPLLQTVRDTLAWARVARKRLGALRAGLSPEREHDLLTAFAGPAVRS
jgi:2'-hydroxyisoflavone reductase